MGALKQRGVSVLAAVVFVAILTAVAAGVQSTLPAGNPAAQTAATEAATAKTTKADAKLKGDSRCNAPIEVKKDKNAKGSLDGEKGVESVCVKGCQYKIYPGTITTVDGKDTCKDIADAASKKKCETEKPCDVLQCSGPAGACASVGGGSDKKKDEILGRAALVPEYFKNDSAIQKLLNDAKTNPAAATAAVSSLDPHLQAAFSEAKADEQAKIQSKQADNYAAIQRLGEDDMESKRLAEENKKLAEQNANLNKIDTEKLASEQKQLTPDDAATMPPYVECNADKSYCFGVVSPADAEKLKSQGFTCEKDTDGTYGCERTKTAQQQCPPGSTGTPPDKCVRVGQQTFQDPNATKATPSNSSGPLDSFLKGLANAFRPQPPAPPQATPQQCSTDPNAYAQQQQQYQQQMQQYQYQLQMYQYQQQQSQYYAQQQGGYMPPQQPLPAQPVACTPSTQQQCQMQPQQPNPNNCTTGTWRPTYSGSCITNWQCIPTGGGAPVATLSCEPKVADVGMPIAITYGCSSGIASSSSFTVTTQPGGSATTTVANPPAGTNTATYSLACIDGNKTSGAQCSVQVSRPTIILVANPKTVPANGTSLLSWLTTGMTSCVISSPDQEDFTERNSSNTSVAGAATTSPITMNTMFLLHCETVAGGTKEATTTVSVAE